MGAPFPEQPLVIRTPRAHLAAVLHRAPGKKLVIVRFTRWAAAACIIVLAGIGTWHLVNRHEQGTPVLQAKTNAPAITPATNENAKAQTPVMGAPTLLARTEPQKIKTRNPGAITNEAGPVNSKDALEALSDIENSFTQVINLQRARVSTTPMYAETPEYFNDFKIQIKQIERDEKVIKSDIAKRGLTDELLDQLINLYEQKLNTLKQLQIEMNKTNNRFKQNRGPVDSTRTYFLNI